MNADKLSICPKCGGDCCYIQEINDKITTYSCMGCGFHTNSLMKKGEEFYEEQLNVLPELYKDLVFEDKDGKNWLPLNINLPEQGMIFANGSSTKNWKWAAVKSVEVNDDEKEKYPIPGKKGQFYKHRMDMTTMKMFDEKDFIEALSFIEVLPE